MLPGSLATWCSTSHGTNGLCLFCEAPYHEAPDLMGTDDESCGYHCHFRKQPTTPEEIERAIRACQVSCVEAVRYAGNDPAILARFQELRSAASCDTLVRQSATPPPSEGDSVRGGRAFWRRLAGIAPVWAWGLAAVIQVAFVLPFWLHSSSEAPYHDVHGDLSRGWPLVYGLDQGDVEGDEWGPFTTYFGPGQFAVDTAAAVACGLPATALVLWAGWRVLRSELSG